MNSDSVALVLGSLLGREETAVGSGCGLPLPDEDDEHAPTTSAIATIAAGRAIRGRITTRYLFREKNERPAR
jgi:hypothetical protein